MKIGNYEFMVPFVTTAAESVKVALELAEIVPGMKMVDLGSGDGRVILEFAKRRVHVTGFEIKEELVQRSQKRAEELGLTENVRVKHKSYEEENLSEYDLVYIYGMQSVMGKVETKLENELKPGTKVISNVFRFPHWKIKKSKDSVHLYIKK